MIQWEAYKRNMQDLNKVRDKITILQKDRKKIALRIESCKFRLRAKGIDPKTLLINK